MKIELIIIGRTRTDWIQQGIDTYAGRLKHYLPFEIRCIPDVKSGKLTEQQQKELEGKKILELTAGADKVVLLDERGGELTSRQFATTLKSDMDRGLRRVAFVIGGAYGFSQEVYDSVPTRGLLSLSKMTFTHEMVRLFFVEQIYRAMTILRGEPYHHD